MFDFLLDRPIVLLLALALPLVLLARFRETWPTKRLLLLMALPAVTSLLQVFVPAAIWLLGIALVAALALAFIDAFTLMHPRSLSATRKHSRTISIGKSSKVSVELVNKSTGTCRMNVRDDLPDEFVADIREFNTVIGGESRTIFHYDLTSSSRGQFSLNCVYAAIKSSLGLWVRYCRLPCESIVNVYPDMQQIAEYDLLARTNRLSQMGVRRIRRIGQDNEFERLRDYTKDDNYKHIDWRTTARRRKLTVKDFQSNQSQRIIFLVDCGRMMTGQSGDLSLIDHSFNAMLMLSYIALKQGDSVGLLNFSNEIHSYTPPKGGIAQVNRLLHASFDQKARYVESRYDKAFLYLKTHCTRRSLVVLITNVIDEINAGQIQQYLTNLTGHHLPLCLLLKDHDLFDMVDGFETSPQAMAESPGLFHAAAAATIVDWRQQVLSDLKHRGVLAIESFPEQMTAQMINQYLEIKARHLL